MNLSGSTGRCSKYCQLARLPAFPIMSEGFFIFPLSAVHQLNLMQVMALCASVFTVFIFHPVLQIFLSPWGNWGLRGFAQGKGSENTLPTLGSELAPFQSQAQHPKIHSSSRSVTRWFITIKYPGSMCGGDHSVPLAIRRAQGLQLTPTLALSANPYLVPRLCDKFWWTNDSIYFCANQMKAKLMNRCTGIQQSEDP